MFTNHESIFTKPRLTRLSLSAIIFLSAVGYVILGFRFPLVEQIRHIPAGDIRTFAPGLLGGLLYGSLLLGLFLLLILAFNRASRLGLRDFTRDRVFAGKPLLLVLSVTLLFAVPLVLAYPINSVDVLYYAMRGRIAVIHGGNPYLDSPASFPNDPLVALLGEWSGETSPYGPVWEGVGAIATIISGDHYLINVLLLKVIALACFLGSAALIWMLLDRPHQPDNEKRRLAYTLLWAWNPALLLTFVVDAHNDALMLFLLLLGVWFARRRHYTVAILTMVLAALTKPAAALVLPFFVIGYLHEIADRRAAMRFVVEVLAGSAILTWLSFSPWPSPTGSEPAPIALALRLTREAMDGAGFSPSAWVYFISQAIGIDVSIEAIGVAARLLFMIPAVLLLRQAWRGRSPLRGTADIFCAYFLTALNFRIWYAAWPFPWLLLDDDSGPPVQEQRGMNLIDRPDYRLRVGFWFLVTTQLSVVLYGHLRVYLLGGQHLLAHLIGVPLVFLLPLALARSRRLAWVNSEEVPTASLP